MTFPADCLVFDLDGTLVDTAPDLTASIDHMLTTLGRQPAGDANVRVWVGNGMDNLLKRALRHNGGGEPDEALLGQARALFREHYGVHYCDSSRLYPTVRESLDELARRGLPMAVVTNKPLGFTLPLVERLGIAGCFGVVLGGDSLTTRKPDPEPLFEAVRRLAPGARAPLMVGDSINDIQAARNAGWPVVALTYGYNHGQDIRDGSPDAVIDSLAELPPLLAPPPPQS